MKLVKCSAVCLFVVSASCVWPARAEAQSAQAQLGHADIRLVVADLQVFVEKYVAALNAKDVAQIRALYHTSVLACITPETASYYDGLLAAQWRTPIPADYSFRVSAVNDKRVKALESMGRFPIPPARELQIDYQQGDEPGTVTLWLVWEKDRLYGDAPCATEQTLRRSRNDGNEP